MPVLQVQDLRTEFRTDEGDFPAVDGVSFSVDAGKTLAIVGESGCGKSVTALSIMGLVPDPPGRITAGSIRFEGRELVGAPKRELLDLRGNGMAMIFQEPMSSLNPAFTIGDQIVEGLLRHRRSSRAEAQARAIEVLRQVRIPAPEQRFHEYPHKLSGGMRQRAMIAMALACKPRLLIADEPTTALDVTIQAQILELMRVLRDETGTAVILITHDLGVVAEVADEVAVMYSGRIVERASARAIFEAPQHPYTVGLLGSIPRLDVARERLASIEGQVPSPLQRPTGCNFADRCPFAIAKCRSDDPPLMAVGDAHLSACWRAPLDPDALLPQPAQAVALA
ncbi:ABC transporter ATP-binding protein [Ramlibacter sp.]|uniref:ABC transporter ATP-binding protein n=1 Tax=Ramlibacter sp. TaxID=1917967 RepID=UPI002620D625|nr:ABC transporter ATP-binding protein [Ramlibacter sp.]MDB5957935.1 transporter ATP-binding protein [Ramlibacter sp.]